MTQNKHARKHPRIPDPQRVAKAARKTLVTQAVNAALMEAAAHARPKAERKPLDLPGSLAERRRRAKAARQTRRAA